MDLLEVSVEANSEAAEALSEIFNRYGKGGAVIEERPGEPPPRSLVVKTYLPPGKGQGRRLHQLEEAIWHLRQIHDFPEPQIRVLAERDWAHAWRDRYSIQRIGSRLIVKPSWLNYTPQPGEVMVTLDPGLAFGTGLHPTTRLCLIELERRLDPSMRVLDLGTGSGILAIFAAKLNAKSVLALDTDPTAVKVARSNIALNGVESQVQGRLGTISDGDAWRESFDLILANILAQVIQELAPRLAKALAPGGLLIASGIFQGQEGPTKLALEAQGLRLAGRQKQGGWFALVGKKSSSRSAS